MNMSIEYWLRKAASTLAALVDIIPGKVDDFLLSLLNFALNDAVFLAWIRGLDGPGDIDARDDGTEDASDDAQVVVPHVAGLMGRWKDKTPAASALPAGTYIELFTMIVQFIQWAIKKRNGNTPAT